VSGAGEPLGYRTGMNPGPALLAASLVLAGTLAPAAPSPAPSWPVEIRAGEPSIALHRLQIESQEGEAVRAKAAVVVRDKGLPSRTGAIWVSARTDAAAETSRLQLCDLTVVKGSFPSERDGGTALVEAVGAALARETSCGAPSLPPLPAGAAPALAPGPSLAPAPSLVPAPSPDTPRVVFTDRPAVVVHLDGEAEIRPVEGTSWLRVVNTRSLVLQDKGTSRFFTPVAGRWLVGPGLGGDWGFAKHFPPGLDALATKLSLENGLDLATQPADDVRAWLRAGKAPAVVFFTRPTVVLRASERRTAVPGNLDAELHHDAASSRFFLRADGAWYRARSREGPWKRVAVDAVPKEFGARRERSPAPAPRRDPRRGDDLYVGPDTNVFRSRADGGWDKTNGLDWYPVQRPYPADIVGALDREREARRARPK